MTGTVCSWSPAENSFFLARLTFAGCPLDEAAGVVGLVGADATKEGIEGVGVAFEAEATVSSVVLGFDTWDVLLTWTSFPEIGRITAGKG